MNNHTAMYMNRPAHDIFEAFVDPAKIGKFWFSSSSARWEQGKTVTLRYEEYDAEGNIRILKVEADRLIVFRWGDGDQDHLVTISLTQPDPGRTLVEVTEEGFPEDGEDLIPMLVGNKEGWVYMLTCLKGYLEYGAVLRAALAK